MNTNTPMIILNHEKNPLGSFWWSKIKVSKKKNWKVPHFNIYLWINSVIQEITLLKPMVVFKTKNTKKQWNLKNEEKMGWMGFEKEAFANANPA